MGRLHLKFPRDLSFTLVIPQEREESMSLVIVQVNTRMEQGRVLWGEIGFKTPKPLTSTRKEIEHLL